MGKTERRGNKSGGTRFMIEGVIMNAVMVSYRRFTEVMPEHAHGENVYEIHLVTEGRGSVCLNKERYDIFPGVLYLTGPGVLHEQLPEEGGYVTEFGLYLQAEGEQKGGDLLQALRSCSVWCGEGKEELMELSQKILLEQENNRIGSVEKTIHLLAEFFIECIRSMRAGGEEARALPVPEEEFLSHKVREENVLLVADELFLYEYRDITLEGLAKRLGFSPRQAQRFLKRMYGKTFTRKRLEARMSAAVTMLLNSRYTITEISERLGYSSVEHFSHAFSEYYGYMPSKMRKRENR